MNEEIDFAKLETIASKLIAEGERSILAIIGAPGAGKSTLAEKLQASLSSTHPMLSEVVPMDGFHYDDMILDARGRRPWKGAPDTFDVEGLRVLYERLLRNDEEICVPVFDRDLEISRGSARIVPQSTQLIITEGNYLLLDDMPWKNLKSNFAVSVFVDVPESELRRRLVERWTRYGLDEEQIRRKLNEVDLPNGRKVIESRKYANYLYPFQ